MKFSMGYLLFFFIGATLSAPIVSTKGHKGSTSHRGSTASHKGSNTGSKGSTVRFEIEDEPLDAFHITKSTKVWENGELVDESKETYKLDENGNVVPEDDAEDSLMG